MFYSKNQLYTYVYNIVNALTYTVHSFKIFTFLSFRVLAEFQSRKAHRVHVRDKDLLKYLCVVLVVVVAYMTAWTAVNMDHLEYNNSTILETYEPEGLGEAYTFCRSMWWDWVVEIG